MGKNLTPTIKTYRYQQNGGKRIKLPANERVTYKLYATVDLETYKELKARGKQFGIASTRLMFQMVRKCLDDMNKVNGDIAPF